MFGLCGPRREYLSEQYQNGRRIHHKVIRYASVHVGTHHYVGDDTPVHLHGEHLRVGASTELNFNGITHSLKRIK